MKPFESSADKPETRRLIQNRWAYYGRDGKLHYKRIDPVLKAFAPLMRSKDVVDRMEITVAYPTPVLSSIVKLVRECTQYDSRPLTLLEAVSLTVYLIGLFDNTRYMLFTMEKYRNGAMLIASGLLTVVTVTKVPVYAKVMIYD